MPDDVGAGYAGLDLLLQLVYLRLRVFVKAAVVHVEVVGRRSVLAPDEVSVHHDDVGRVDST